MPRRGAPSPHDGALELPRLSARLHLGVSPFDPATITDRVGLQPTQARRLGDLAHPENPRAQLRMRQDEWMIRAGPRQALDLGDLIDELYAKLQPRWEQLVAECAKGDLEPVVACVVSRRSEQSPIIHLPPQTVSWIGALGAVLDIDIL